MMTPDDMEITVKALMARGLPRAKAEDYALYIGDTPEIDGNGLWLIRDDNGNVIDAIQPLEEE